MKSFLLLMTVFVIGIIMLMAEIQVASDYMRSLTVSERYEDTFATFLVIIGLAIAVSLVLTPLFVMIQQLFLAVIRPRHHAPSDQSDNPFAPPRKQ